MTRVRIAQPDTEEDVSAEQVTAYLARGWRYAGLDTEQCWQVFRLGRKRAELPVDPKMRRRASMLASIIDDIARAEQRHPSAVLADVAGPARAASVGARCEPWLLVAELRVRLSCKLPACDLMGCSAARGAGESEEP